VNSDSFLLAVTAVALALSLSGCKVSESIRGTAGQAAPADFPGVTNRVPASPRAGQSRLGTAYNVYIQAAGTGDKVAFTVFEPSTLEGGKTYPLVLQASGFSLSRETPSNFANVKPLVEAGYGVISFDHRGHGESGGVVRSMDPDYEGKDVLAVLDWAEARLDWLKYRPSAGDPHNLVLGSMGGSYGGMYQYLLHNIDPKHRLDAMAVRVAPNDLTYSNFPGGVSKASYLAIRVQAGKGPAFDPYARSTAAASLQANKMVEGYADFLYYHSNQYFCADRRVATNGGPGTAPEHPPQRGPKVNAILFQGMRDTLFNFNEAYANYQCLRSEGGDVRLLSYQSGHNDAYVVPDPGEAYLPPGNVLDRRCGSLDSTAAMLAFFDQYLKDVPGGADAVPIKPCLSIARGDAVLVSQVMTMQGLSVSVLNAIYHRRSIRAYAPMEVDEDTVQQLLHAAVQAPTARHAEPWAFVVIQDRALLEHISDVTKGGLLQRAEGNATALGVFGAPGFNIFYDAGTLILICGKTQTPFVAADCWLAAENLMLAAHAMGLGSCVIGSAVTALNEELKEKLGIAAEITIHAPIIVGFPREEAPLSPRKPPLLLRYIKTAGLA